MTEPAPKPKRPKLDSQLVLWVGADFKDRLLAYKRQLEERAGVPVGLSALARRLLAVGLNAEERRAKK